jgi:TolA-binding protein
VENTNNDVAELRNRMEDLNTQMNRMQQLLTDLNNNIKVMAAPKAAEPPPPTAAQTPPPPDASTVFNNAVRDETGGKLDLAISEYGDFIKFYPDNPNAARAQYNIGNCYYTKQQYDMAAQNFDKVITGYAEDVSLTPQAYFMKGMSLKATDKKAAIGAWRQVIAKYPGSDAAKQAKGQLTAAGATASVAPAPKKRISH